MTVDRTNIALTRDCAAKCWTATFHGGAMPQGIPLPLPVALEASYLAVAKHVARLFPLADIRKAL